jgi:hypothetical protein
MIDARVRAYQIKSTAASADAAARRREAAVRNLSGPGAPSRMPLGEEQCDDANHLGRLDLGLEAALSGLTRTWYRFCTHQA